MMIYRFRWSEPDHCDAPAFRDIDGALWELQVQTGYHSSETGLDTWDDEWESVLKEVS